MISKMKMAWAEKLNRVSFLDEDGDEYREGFNEPHYVSVSRLLYGDYVGCLDYRMNFEAVEKECDEKGIDTYIESGYYGARQIYISMVGFKNWEYCKECLEDIEQNIIYDEDFNYQRKDELAYEEWGNSGHSEMIEALEDKLSGWPKLSKGKSWQLWNKINENGDLFDETNCGVYFVTRHLDRDVSQDEIDLFLSEMYPNFVRTEISCEVDVNTFPFIQMELIAA